LSWTAKPICLHCIEGSHVFAGSYPVFLIDFTVISGVTDYIGTMLSCQRSQELFNESNECIPGGVNSPVRAFRAVGGTPFFVESAQGCRVKDVDGNDYIDYVGTWGPAIHGHANPEIQEAISNALSRGTSFGIPHPGELTMAETICETVPSVEMVRMCNSGTEATMSTVRLARGYTGRDKIIKFDGCYHGHVDSLLVKAGSGALTFGNPDSAGIPSSFAEHTIVVPFNDREAVRNAFEANEGKVAGVILEPIPGNAGVFPPQEGFLDFLRAITREFDALLIFDEVMTGFRVSLGGAQERYKIQPDLTCLGKIIGGGLPVGAFGGRREIMEQLAPNGPVYQAGTLSGNPLAIAAGLASLKKLKDPEIYVHLEDMGRLLEQGYRKIAAANNISIQLQRVGAMFCLFFNSNPIRNLEGAMSSDRERFNRYFHGMLEQGIYFAPSAFEAGFLSTAHQPKDIEATLDAAKTVFSKL